MPEEPRVVKIAFEIPGAKLCKSAGDKLLWEADFYTPPVLGGAARFDNSAPAVYKNLVP